MFLYFLSLLIATVILITVVFFYVSSIIATLPKGTANNLLQTKPIKAGRVIACIGDSLTHGNIGDCWVDNHRGEFPEDIFLNQKC